ncbi:MAG: HPF/RaiA family ribosome-associated protein [Candidatus Coatesbacteria bacterium]|nr:HPF/RaiA family ribosome-associated protein [Candidatus Coatesbacteria bacterium]
MNITFVSRHYELNTTQKSFIESKLKSVRERYFDKRLDVQVELTSEKSRQRCELNVRSDRFQEQLRVESHDMQQSIVEAIEKLEMILRKRHDKQVNRKRVEKREQTETQVEAALEAPTDEVGEEIAPVDLPEIIETGAKPSKPITVTEAAMLLQESGDQFIAFRDASENEFAVLFRRQDGKLGLQRHGS